MAKGSRRVKPAATPSPEARTLFQRAEAAHLAGDLEGADALYRQALRQHPGDAPSLHRLGMIAAQRGQHPAALEHFDAALRSDPGLVEAYRHRAALRRILGEFDAELADLERALNLDPCAVAAWEHFAGRLGAAGRAEQARQAYQRLIELGGASAKVHAEHAGVLADLGLTESALAAYGLALELDPDLAQAYNNRATLLIELARDTEALGDLDAALRLDSAYADAHCNRAQVLLALGRNEAALASLDRAIELQDNLARAYLARGDIHRAAHRLEKAAEDYRRVADSAEESSAVHNRLGIVLGEMGRHEEALACYDRAIDLEPDNAENHSNRGTALSALGRYDEAMACQERALAIDPDLAQAFCNRGLVWVEWGEHRRALDDFNQAIELDPDYAQAHWNRGLCALSLGDYRQGWRDYEWRWRVENFQRDEPASDKTAWLGETPLTGKTLLLTSEQGLGDMLQFGRFASRLALRGARVIMQMPVVLLGILRGLDGVEAVVAKGAPPPEHDLHSPLMSLPLALGIELADLPVVSEYLHADPERVAQWGKRLGGKEALRVGLVWSGNPKHKNDRRRSLGLSDFFDRLPGDPRIEYHSLQQEVRAEDVDALASRPEIRHWGGRLDDFADTAALCMHMDVIVCVDTGVAHLAGALGRPTWVLLDVNPDWCWLRDREDSPWYPSVRLFRQDRPGDWASAFAKLMPELLALAEGHTPRVPDLAPAATSASRDPPGDALHAAAAAHLAGRLAQAEAAYREALACQPDSFDAAHLLGVVLAQTGRAEAGLAFLDQAVSLDPRSAAALNNRAGARAALGRNAEAEADFRRALELKPDFAEAHSGLGGLLLRQGHAEAALASLERASVLAPEITASHFERAQALRALGRQEEAVAGYGRALVLQPNDPLAFYYRGTCQLQLGRAESALADFDAALGQRPDMAEAHNNRGNALRELGRLDEALAALRRAVELRPTFAEAHYNLGVALREAGDSGAALAAYDRAIALKADFADAHYNRGIVLKDLKRPVDALASYDQAIALRPDFVEAHWNAGLCALQSGDYARGWVEYEWRWRRPAGIPLRRDFTAPLWLGEASLAGKTVLLHSEHGYGDTLQFCRYASLVAAQGARVIFEVERPLLDLLASLDGVTAWIAKGDTLPDFDLHCPLMSLGLAFKTDLASIPAPARYLTAPAERVAAWATRLGPRTRPRLGIVWSGNPQHGNDARRSLAFAELAAALPADLDIELHCLQKIIRDADLEAFQARPDIRDWRAELHDFADTAALCEAMDLVLSVDTSVAHLAGALGRPVWVLLPGNPDWRWLLDREDSPWYPSARLFRQASRGDWAPVLQRVAAALRTHFGATASDPVEPVSSLAPEAPAENPAEYLRRAYALKQRGDFVAALAGYDRALALRADYPQALNGRAICFHSLGRLPEARADLERAIALDPDYVDAHANLGSILSGLGQPEAAEASLVRALALDPGHAGARVNLGIALADRGRAEAALSEFDRVLTGDPGHAIAQLNRGNALEVLDQPEAALAAYDRAIALRPDWAEAHNNRGNILRHLGRRADALEAYRRAIQLDPARHLFHCNQGIVLNDLERRAEALASFARALELAPDDAEAHWNRAICLLQIGDFRNGWAEYEWRWRCPAHAKAQRRLPRPLLRAARDAVGKTVLLHSEQGLGDALQFCRYAEPLAALGARVVLEVQAPLRALLGSLAGVETLLAQGEALPEFDLHCPLLSLPLAFGTDLASIPASPRYLAAPTARVVAWQARLGPASRRRVGIVWSGNPAHGNDTRRSLTLADLASALPADLEIELHCLQKEVRDVDLATLRARPDIRDWRAELRDFADTAALCEAMDLVLSVDTSVAHLAGALGQPVWILLPSNPDWRWLLDREDSPWYPSARLLRQSQADDWTAPLARLGIELAGWLEKTASEPRSSPASQAGLAIWQADRAARADDLDRAASLYRQAHDACPESALAAARLGDLAWRAGRLDESRSWYEQATGRDPGDVAAHFNLARIANARGDDPAALVAYARILELNPDLAEAYNNRAIVLARQGHKTEALDDYRRAVKLKPTFAEAHYNLGNLLRDLARLEEARIALEQAIALTPGSAEAHHGLGLLYTALGMDVDAAQAFARALELKPVYLDARLNHANALANLGHYKAALETFDRVLASDPEHAMARVNRALCLLQRGDFSEGWREYQWRWRLSDAGIAPRQFDVPLWLGETSPAGKRILLHSEQGLGDTLQFCRYVGRVAALGARVILEVEPALRGLLAGLPGVDALIVKGETAPDHDLHCPLLSLPLAFGSDLGNLPAEVPYLAADPDKVAAWAARLGATARPRLGLVWSGSRAHKGDHRRSLTLAQCLAALPEGLDVDLISLQKEVRDSDLDCLAAHPELRHFGADLGDFNDTAALCQAMDLIVCVDTSVAHLAGALGKPVWLLLQFNPDWRWLLGRVDSPWYPTARLFRQDAPGDWRPVLRRVAAALATRYGPGSASADPAPATLDTWTEQALALHRRGDLAGAETLYRRILEADPENFDAMHLLGVVEAVGGRHAEALVRLDAALAQRPDASAYHNRARVLRRLGRPDEAGLDYRRALALRPEYADAWTGLADLLGAQGRDEQALAVLDAALEACPDEPGTRLRRARLRKRLGQTDAALEDFNTILAAHPEQAQALNGRGVLRLAMNHAAEAEADLTQAVHFEPDNVDILANLGSVLTARGRAKAALGHLERAVALDPDHVGAHVNLGIAYAELDDSARALAGYQRALEIDPQRVESHVSLGASLADLGRHGEARDAFRRALELSPDDPEAHWNHALACLLLGDYAQGWRDYAWRWRRPANPPPAWIGGRPAWRGEAAGGEPSLARRTLLLHSDQGYGDSLQFCRYAHLAAQRGARVVLYVEPALTRLLADLAGVAGVVGKDAPAPAFDQHCALLDLPLACAPECAPPYDPGAYLTAPAAASAAWRARLGAPQGARVGVIWRGNPAHKNDRRRSLPLAGFLACLPSGLGVEYHCLHHTPHPDDAVVLTTRPDIRVWHAELGDFADLAGLCSKLDLVIAVDTAGAHLAGALGLPVWLLLPFNPDWRWLLARDDSPWYATARLFRQAAPGDWPGVLGRVAAALAAFVASLGAWRADPAEVLDDCLTRAAERHRAGDLETAESLYWRVRAARPENFDASHLLGVIAAQTGRVDAALAWFEQARRLNPDNVDLLRNRGRLLRRSGRYDEALADYDSLLDLLPEDAEARGQRARLLFALGRAEAVLADCVILAEARPEDAEIEHLRGSALQALGRADAALTAFERALALHPGHAEARNNRANALRALGRYPEAQEEYRRAVELRPDYALAQWNLALCRLLLGDFANGWAGMEWRQRLGAAAGTARAFDPPLWLGEASPAGATLLLYAEQGLGDCLQFCRYVPRVAALGARVILEVPASLRPLMLELPGVAEVLALGDPLPVFDLRCPLPSLPLACKTTLANLPAEIPYLRADPAKLATWAARLGRRKGVRVGLVWRGNPAHGNDRRRSLALATLLRALPDDAGLAYYALQKDIPNEDAALLATRADLVDLGGRLDDFADTAALCALMDLVLCVDTSVAHLAGALGRPTWILLPFDPDWRWLVERADSPWYPSARLYRQARPDDWSEPLRQIGAALRVFQGDPQCSAADAVLGLDDDALWQMLRETSPRHAAGETQGVETAYRRIAAARPDWFDPWHLLGVVAAQDDRPAWAVEAIGRALNIDPENASAYGNRGNALQALGRYPEAIKDYDRAFGLCPEYLDACINRGHAYVASDDLEAALANYRQVTNLDPGYAAGYYNQGIVLSALGRRDEALDCYDQAVKVDPGYVDARWNRAILKLLLGRLREGWADYELRWQRKPMSRSERHFTQPCWLGDTDLAGKTLLLHYEQGFGDTLQFCRYAAPLHDLGATIVLGAQPPLLSLLKRLPGVSMVVEAGGELPDFDLHCPLLSLPLAFDTRLETIPAEVPYLHADPAKIAAWEARLGPRAGPRVGLVWSGNAQHDNDRRRSLRLADLLAALPMDRGIDYHCLQKEVRALDEPVLAGHPELGDWRAELADFADTAALCACMDLVLSVDTSVAHLAGALGRPLWLLLPRNPDWRWLLEREDSPWYPTARLFRQVDAGAWDEVLARVAVALRQRF